VYPPPPNFKFLPGPAPRFRRKATLSFGISTNAPPARQQFRGKLSERKSTDGVGSRREVGSIRVEGCSSPNTNNRRRLMRCHRKRTLWVSVWCGLAVLALALGGGRVHAAEEKEEVKKSNGSYLSAKGKINVTRFDPAAPGPHPAVLFLHGIDGADKY